MLIDKDAAIAAIRRLEIDGPQMIWSSDAIDAVQSNICKKLDDLGNILHALTSLQCRVFSSIQVHTVGK